MSKLPISATVIPVTLAVREVTEALPANVFIAPKVVASAATVPRFTVITLPVPVAFVNSLLIEQNLQYLQ